MAQDEGGKACPVPSGDISLYLTCDIRAITSPHTIEFSGIRLSGGAKFVVGVAGNMMIMPSLQRGHVLVELALT